MTQPTTEQRMLMYAAIANAIVARTNCERSGNTEWYARWTERLAQLADLLPSGSGVDSGTTIDLERSTGAKIVLGTAYHHMDEGGGYSGWTEHAITIRPAFIGGIDLTIGGRDRNGIKEYLGEMYHADLTREVVITADGVSWADWPAAESVG